MRSVSILTTNKLTASALDAFMLHLTAKRDELGWVLERNGHTIWIRLGTQDIPSMFSEEDLIKAGNLVGGGRIQARVSLIYVDSPEGFGLRMVTAVARAMADQWPCVWDDHFGEMKRVEVPGSGGIPSKSR